MKKQLIYIVLFFSIFGYTQCIKATYLHKFLNDKNDSLFSVKEKSFLYNYAYSNKKSIYSLNESGIITNDSIKNGEGNYDLLISVSASKNVTFKDLTKKVFLKEYSIYDTNFSIKDNLSDFEWSLIDEEITIKGYKCKKAITNKESFSIKAWYCEDIPINDGPDRFYGLPGFILKIELGEYSIIEIDQLSSTNNNLNIEKPINKNEYLTLRDFKKEEIALYKKKANEN